MTPAAGPAEALAEFVREKLGSHDVAVEAAGPAGEIAVVRLPSSRASRLMAPEVRAAVAGEARRLGYRHAALDLDFLDGPPEGPGTTEDEGEDSV